MAATIVPTASTASTSQETRNQQPVRPRRGRGQPRRADNSRSTAQASTIDPNLQSSMTPVSGPEETSSSNRSRGSGGRRGRVSGRAGHVPENRTVNGRAFGGQLTQDDTDALPSKAPRAQLRARAEAFVPENQLAPTSAAQEPSQHQLKKSAPAKRRASKSQAPDIATRTHEDIDNGFYECPICTNEVRRNSRVWSCHTCWTVFHFTCIKKWSSNQGSSSSQPAHQDGELPPPRQWRCPGCNLPKDAVPQAYTCWCEKETDPRTPAGLPPHSCGQTCGKERVRKCPHPCQLTCHAGPCPPCTHMGPTQSCFCGKHETTKRCFETNYQSGWSCGEVCGSSTSCDEHPCTKPCHEGPCGACAVVIPSRCYCGCVEKEVLCSDRGDRLESRIASANENDQDHVDIWTGTFDCGGKCNRLFDCGTHRCQKQCHPQDTLSGHCPLSPDIVTHCPCGKATLSQLSTEHRSVCSDPIPRCDEPCGKVLNCGHLCHLVCHSGPCSSCMETVTISCRCGRTSSRSICHQGKEEPPQCARVCKANLNCGRHSCEERCCTGERKAIERQAAKRKQRPLGTPHSHIEDTYEAEHICTRQCDRPLKCGNHFCEELCHKGPCGTCREAIFDEISCNCGRTVLQPPLACGTRPPVCRFPCERTKSCGHPQVAHTCHDESEGCPKCPFLMEKRCMCSRKVLKNQPCWLLDVRCGEICGKKLKCGAHFCRKLCHRPGECEDANGEACKQPCGKEKKACGHPDDAPCHAPYPCKEDQPCSSKIFITCACQAQKQELKCAATRTSEGNRTKSLPCNDECARLERNRKLALALNIDQSTHVDGGDHIPYSTETLSLFAENVKWAQSQEREFRVFAAAEDEKRLRLKPMPAPQRSFLHALAEDFGLDSESMDPEPHRHVMVWKTPRFVSAPKKSLADAWRLRQALHKPASVPTNLSDNETTSPARALKSAATTTTSSAQPFNAFVLSAPSFGLTIDDVRAEVAHTTAAADPPLAFDISFLPSERVVLKAVTRTLPPADLERTLQTLHGPLAAAVTAKRLGSGLQLCCVDASLNITRLEADGVGTGWSRVAAKKAAPPRMNLPGPTAGAANAFAPLSGGAGKVTFAKKKPPPPEPHRVAKPKAQAVVDDWEAAELAEEERERVATEGHVEEDTSSALATEPVEERHPDEAKDGGSL